MNDKSYVILIVFMAFLLRQIKIHTPVERSSSNLSGQRVVLEKRKWVNMEKQTSGWSSFRRPRATYFSSNGSHSHGRCHWLGPRSSASGIQSGSPSLDL